MMQLIKSKTIDKNGIRRILVRSTNWVGDAVMTLPALEAVKQNFPESSITVLARPWVVPLFKCHPAVDEVMPYEKRKGFVADLAEMARVINVIRKQEFDLAVVFQNAFEAAFLTYFGGVRYRLGYNTDGRGILLSHRVVRNKEVLKVHQVEYYLSLLRAMGLEAASGDPEIYIADGDMEKAGDILHSKGIQDRDFLVGLSPGAIYGEAKRWPPDRFARIGDWAAEKWHARVLVMGSPKETDICESVCASMTNEVFNLCGRTSLSEAMGVIRHCGFFVTNDSGLMHVASALGVPTVAVFGSTDPVATGPRGPNTRIVKHDIECAPCLKPVCPTDYRCMLSIQPEEVWNEMVKLKETL